MEPRHGGRRVDGQIGAEPKCRGFKIGPSQTKVFRLLPDLGLLRFTLVQKDEYFFSLLYIYIYPTQNDILAERLLLAGQECNLLYVCSGCNFNDVLFNFVPKH